MGNEAKIDTRKRYAVSYHCDADSFNRGTWHTMAYDVEHAIEKFYDSEDGEAGWVVDGAKLAPRKS